MADITIKFDVTKRETEPYNPNMRTQICSVFFPDASYIDGKPYEDTIWDTNVWDKIGTLGFLEEYLGSITAAPTTLILFKAAAEKAYEENQKEPTVNHIGAVKVTEDDAKKVENIREIGKALAKFGFSVEGADIATAEAGEKVETGSEGSGE